MSVRLAADLFYMLIIMCDQFPIMLCMVYWCNNKLDKNRCTNYSVLAVCDGVLRLRAIRRVRWQEWRRRELETVEG